MKTTSLALDHLLRAVGDPVAELKPIGPEHAEFNLAQTLRAGIGVMAKSPDALPAIALAIRPVAGLPMSRQMRAHRAAAAAWLSGNPVLAAERYESILSKWPRDLLALRLAQSCYFFLGGHERFCELIDAVMSAWRHDERGFDFVLAMASFAHAENGDTEYAELLGRKALANDPACPVGVHAVAHAMAESGRPLEGAKWMREQRAHWSGDSRMRTHNAWHLAWFDAEDGDVASALNILDACLLPASARFTLDACDAAALLGHLATDGIDVASRWSRLSDAFEAKLTPGFWPYVDLHAAVTHLCAGELARLDRLTEVIEQCAQGDNFAAMRARHITEPWIRALKARAEGRHSEAATLFAGLKPVLGQAGGSRLQLEAFQSIGEPSRRRQPAMPDSGRNSLVIAKTLSCDNPALYSLQY
jgi:hypothetical protein